jgi:hypothetical protein
MEHTRQHQVTEVKAEQSARRSLWQRVPGTQNQFMSLEYQRRYDTMKSVLLVLEMMTDREFQTIKERIERHEAAAAAQTKLFTT